MTGSGCRGAVLVAVLAFATAGCPRPDPVVRDGGPPPRDGAPPNAAARPAGVGGEVFGIALPADAKPVTVVDIRSAEMDALGPGLKAALVRDLDRIGSRRVNVIFAGAAAPQVFQPVPVVLDDGTRGRLAAYIAGVRFGMATSVLPALERAIDGGEGHVIIVSDEDVETELVETITARNRGRCTIHAVRILMPDPTGHEGLRRLADRNGGHYVVRRGNGFVHPQP